MTLNSYRIRCLCSCHFVLFMSLMHFLILLLNYLSWCLSPFAVFLLFSMCFLISSSPSLIFSFLLFCDLSTSPVIFASSFVAAAFASSPGLYAAAAFVPSPIFFAAEVFASSPNLGAAAAFASSPRLRVAEASATSLPSACSVSAAAAFESSFKWCAAATSATTPPSACSNSVEYSVIVGFYAVAAVSASCLIFLSGSA